MSSTSSSSSSSSSNLSSNSQKALKHLKTLKPYDGWSCETINRLGTTEVRLLRRNVPLTDRYFRDLFVEPSGRIVGMIALSTKQGQVLVDSKGTPIRHKLGQTAASRTVQIPSYEPSQNFGGGIASSSIGEGGRRGNHNAQGDGESKLEGDQRSQQSSSSSSSSSQYRLSREENYELLRLAACGIGISILLRVLMQTLFVLYLLVVPILYLYAVQKCPKAETFDTKREIKRVLRGHHLPEDHPDKPKGWINETLAKVQASVATELATGLSGYEVSRFDLLGAAHIITVEVPSVETKFYWIGALEKWRYVYSHSTSRSSNNQRYPPSSAAAASHNHGGASSFAYR